jgi:hypothetical protein
MFEKCIFYSCEGRFVAEIRIISKKRKGNLFFIRTALAWLLMVGCLLVIYIFTIGSHFTFKHVIIFSLFCIPLSFLYSVFVEKIGSHLGAYLSGWSSRKVSRRETILADLGKARYCKMQGSYEEALDILNGILDRIPNASEALLLMAQVQWEGFRNFSEAKRCLQKIMHDVPMGETLHNWASSIYDEMMGYEKKRFTSMDRDDKET